MSRSKPIHFWVEPRTLKCGTCGDSFETDRRNRKSCFECRADGVARRALIWRRCWFCHKWFDVNTRSGSTAAKKAKYCSPECSQFAPAYQKKVNRIHRCRHCGKGYAAEGSERRGCWECVAAGKHRKPKAQLPPIWERRGITREQYEKERRHKDRVKWRVARSKKRAKIRKLPSDWSLADRRAAIELANGCCLVCGFAFGLLDTVQMDHWIPLSSDRCPGTVPGNMAPLCSTCNQSKRAADADRWLAYEFGQQKSACAIARRVQRYLRRQVQILRPTVAHHVGDRRSGEHRDGLLAAPGGPQKKSNDLLASKR